MFSDVKRTYFNALVQHELWVDLPEEHDEYRPGVVGRLALALSGWQECLAEHLSSIGFKRGISNPCIYLHELRQQGCLVHGDDYATSGTQSELVWMQGELEKRCEMKTTILGHSRIQGVAREGQILNRIVRATPDGWEYKCDPRHIEVLVEQLNLEDAKEVVTPGID